MTTEMLCAKIGCVEPVAYAKPLCYPHWKEFDRFYIQECQKCHRFDELVGEFNAEDEDDLCMDCYSGVEVAVHAHGPVEHQTRYLYVLKLSDGKFYVGQTDDLEMLLREHQGNMTPSTKGKSPRLVWFERWIGNRKELDAEENAMARAARRTPWAISRMVIEWQRPLRLVDLDA